MTSNDALKKMIESTAIAQKSDVTVDELRVEVLKLSKLLQEAIEAITYFQSQFMGYPIDVEGHEVPGDDLM